MNRKIIDEIYALRDTAAILNSRGRDTTNVDDKLMALYEKYPAEYSQAQKEIYADYGF